MFAYINLCETCDPRVGPFLHQATLNKPGKGLLDDNTYQISRLFACCGSDKRQCKDCWAWPFWSQGHNFNNLVQDHWQMLNIKSLDLEVSDEICVMFSLYKQM